MTLKKSYEAIQKRFGLPPFEDVDDAFSLSSLDTDVLTVKEIGQRVIERLGEFARTIEDLLHPDGGRFAYLMESNAFSDEDRKNLFVLYRKLMLKTRQWMVLDLEGDEQRQGAFLRELFKDWKTIRSRLMAMGKQLCEVWEKDSLSKADLEYLG
ncbi:hypothetical protein D6783_01470 [Candidatus Woesearchaeota archaeon]|nr:MAG: hypothetical protein D6783_01470 [Candidatus Woesearchaeota archaeon]